MWHRLAADLVVLLHALFVVFVVLGGLLVLRWRRAAWVHAPAALWGAWVELSGGTCPLTPLENRLRRLGGEAGYHGGFVEHHVLPVLYPGELTRSTQLLLGALVVAVNLGIYAWLLARPRRRRPG